MMRRMLLVCFLLLCIIHYDCNKEPFLNCDKFSEIIVLDSLKVNRKVLVIGIDGFRSDVLLPDVAPFMYTLAEGNNVYYTSSHSVEKYTSSGPNWSSLLTGVHVNKHEVTNNSFTENNYTHYPSCFNYIEAAASDINTVSIVNWIPINKYILSYCTDFAPIKPINDSLVFEQAKELLINSNPISPDILFLHFDELDGAGHNYGYGPLVPEYTNTLNVLDSYVDSLFYIIENKRLDGEDWMFFIVSDHGGDGTSHDNANNENINKTVFFAEHPILDFKNDYISNQTDLSPTILDFLGISNSKFDCKTDGISLLE